MPSELELGKSLQIRNGMLLFPLFHRAPGVYEANVLCNAGWVRKEEIKVALRALASQKVEVGYIQK